MLNTMATRTVYCLLSTVYYLMAIVYCLLLTVYCLLANGLYYSTSLLHLHTSADVFVLVW